MSEANRVNGPLNYRLEGPQDAPVLVLSNSLGTDLHMWEAQMAAFTGHFRVLRYDTRGHGQSRVTQGPYSIEQNGHDVVALLDALQIERAFFCGLSMGGFGTWDTVMDYPDTYAAAVPICGGAGVRFVMAERIQSLPIWIFHGAKDTAVEPAYSKKMFDVLTKLKAPVKLTIYPDAGHDSWTAAYNDPELWKWLFEQHK